MKKILFVALTALFVMSMTGNAMAAGWWRENINDTINVLAANGADTYQTSTWDTYATNDGATSPHGQFSATTNKCKTCHAVHGALSTSFRLLKNSTREDECNYCHWKAAGASKYRLYAFRDLAKTVRGEHTLGSTVVPDSGLTASGVSAAVSEGKLPNRGTTDGSGNPTLYCFSCHSVHGAYTLETNGDVGWWSQRILRTDPGALGVTTEGAYNAGLGIATQNVKLLGYGTTLTGDTQGVNFQTLADAQTAMTGDAQQRKNAARSAFCAGCHTRNFNWRTNNADGKDYSLQKGSHPLNTDGTLDVGGGAGTSGAIKVSWINANWCGSCHAAPIELGGVTSDAAVPYAGGLGTNFNSAFASVTQDWNTTWFAAGFPHQSESDKLLFDGITTDSAEQTGDLASDINDAYRPLDRMDKICGTCHTNTGVWSTATSGPSKTF